MEMAVSERPGAGQDGTDMGHYFYSAGERRKAQPEGSSAVLSRMPWKDGMGLHIQLLDA